MESASGLVDPAGLWAAVVGTGPVACDAGKEARCAMSYATSAATSRLIAAVAARKTRRPSLRAMTDACGPDYSRLIVA
jgi:hypothetical protein